jgi:putative radical SAM enzyme (TIGR03279 family)
MTYFTELDLSAHPGGIITNITEGSLAQEIDLRIGDQLLAINDKKVEDVIDVQFYSADEELELLIRRGEEYLLFEAHRNYGQGLGIDFQHPTFDTDIRRCNNVCEFCFVLQMAPRYRRTLYIKDDDYRYSFLFGHYVTLTNLNDHDWWKIETMGLSPLYVSVHVTDLELRRQFLRNGDAPDILDQLQRLTSIGIQIHTQLVIVPGLNDGKWLEQSVADLKELWPAVSSISVVPVGITRHHRYGLQTHSRSEARSVLKKIENLQSEFRSDTDMGVGFVHATDEWYLVAGEEIPQAKYYDGLQLYENGLGMVRLFLDEWSTVEEEIKIWSSGSQSATLPKEKWEYDSLTLVTGTLFSQSLQQAADRFAELSNVSVSVLPVENVILGPTITVAGLLMAKDVISELKSTKLGDLVVLPRLMFDHPDLISLDDTSPQDVADSINRPVALADQMGDVWDALTGMSTVIFNPVNQS